MQAHGPIEVETDASRRIISPSGLHRASTRNTSLVAFSRCANSLRARKIVSVRLVRTDEMEADLMTKILERPAFEKHRDSVVNAAAKLRDRVREMRSEAATSSEPHECFHSSQLKVSSDAGLNLRRQSASDPLFTPFFTPTPWR